MIQTNNRPTNYSRILEGLALQICLRLVASICLDIHISNDVQEPQLDLIASLRIFKHLFPDIPEALANPVKDLKHRNDTDKLVSILSWIALFFNIDGRTNVAVGLKFSRQDSGLPSLIISTDDGSVPSITDETIMDEFKKSTFLAFEKPRDIQGNALQFHCLLAQRSWQPIQMAIMKIRDKQFGNTEFNIKDNYLRLMDSWISFLTRVRRPYTSNPSREAIETCFDTLLNESEPDPRNRSDLERRRAEYLVRIARCCEVINGSKFLEASLDSPPRGYNQRWQYNLDETDFFFLHHIQSRIKDVLAINEAAETYVVDGLSHLQALYNHAHNEDNFKQSFHFTWTGQINRVIIPQTIKWTKSPSEWITAYATETGQPMNNLRHLSGVISNCWTKNDLISGRLHCEVAMLDFVQKQGLQLKYNVIGTAKPLCWACREFLNLKEVLGITRSYRYRMDRADYPDDWFALSAVGITENDLEKGCLAKLRESTRALMGEAFVASYLT